MVIEIQRNNQRLAGRHDLFLSELAESDEPFETIVAQFGKGLLNVR